jgi:hypothetical protein
VSLQRFDIETIPLERNGDRMYFCTEAELLAAIGALHNGEGLIIYRTDKDAKEGAEYR